MTAQDTVRTLDPADDGRDRIIALGLLAFLSFLYLLTYSGVPHNPDEWFFLDSTQAVVSGDLSKVQAHGWLFPIIAVPFYGLSMLLPRVGSYQAALLLNVLVTALTGSLLFLALGEFAPQRRLRLATALIYGLGTLAWPYSHYLFREPLAALLLLLASWAMLRFWRRPGLLPLFWAGGALALGVLVKQTLLAFLPFYLVLVAIALVRQRELWLGRARRFWSNQARLPARSRMGRAICWLALAITLALLVLLVAGLSSWFYNHIPGYAFQWPDLSIFAALLVSPGWGLLLFAPALWLSVIGSVSFTQRYPAAAFVALGGSLFYILEATNNPFWFGAWGFGPRQLVPLIPLLCLSMPAGLSELRARWGVYGLAAAGGLALLSGLVQVLGVVVSFSGYVGRVLLPARVFELELIWNWEYWPLVGMWRFWQPEMLDMAWISGRESGSLQVTWSVFLPLAILTLLALGGLIYVAAARRRAALWIPLVTLALWLPAAILMLQGLYEDERYRPAMGYEAAARRMQEQKQPGDVVIADLWTARPFDLSTALLNYCRGGCPERLNFVRAWIKEEDPDWQTHYWDKLAGFRRAWLALERLSEGDENSIVERWLNEGAYLERCEWTGPQVRLCRYSLGRGCSLGVKTPQATLGERIVLQQAEVLLAHAPSCPVTTISPGDTLQLELTWQGTGPIGVNYVVSLQLLDAQGRLAASQDRPPVNGFRPTIAWSAGQAVSDRYALTLPEGASPGFYTLAALMYDPATMQRLPVRLADGTRADAVTLLQVQVSVAR